MDGNGRGEIALLGIGPNRKYLLSEILRSHGIACRAFTAPEQARAWVERSGRSSPLLITEAAQDGRVPMDIAEFRSLFPALRVLPLPWDYRPSEILSLIESAFPPRRAFRSLSSSEEPPPCSRIRVPG